MGIPDFALLIIAKGYGVPVVPKVSQLADKLGVHVNSFKIIYSAFAWLQGVLGKRLGTTQEYDVSASAKVKDVFEIDIKGKKKTIVAGCEVVSGTAKRGSLCRVMRNGEMVAEGKLESLREGKKNVASVQSGKECGIQVEVPDGFHYVVGDIIETITAREVPREFETKASELDGPREVDEDE